jgi:hypothetical protein
MRIRIFDNEGKTIDRYTVQIEQDVYGMSYNPLSYQGINLYSFTLKKGERLGNVGKEINFDDLPEEVQKAVKERMKSGW